MTPAEELQTDPEGVQAAFEDEPVYNVRLSNISFEVSVTGASSTEEATLAALTLLKDAGFPTLAVGTSTRLERRNR